METVEVVHQVGVVNESGRDVLIILNKLITRLDGKSLHHLEMTELVLSNLMQSCHAILHVLPRA